MIEYQIDVLKELKEKGYSTYILKTHNILGGAHIDNLKNKKGITFSTLDVLCELLQKQPGDIIKWVEDPDSKLKEKIQKIPKDPATRKKQNNQTDSE